MFPAQFSAGLGITASAPPAYLPPKPTLTFTTSHLAGRVNHGYQDDGEDAARPARNRRERASAEYKRCYRRDDVAPDGSRGGPERGRVYEIPCDRPQPAARDAKRTGQCFKIVLDEATAPTGLRRERVVRVPCHGATPTPKPKPKAMCEVAMGSHDRPSHDDRGLSIRWQQVPCDSLKPAGRPMIGPSQRP